jgi:hypothetical protein
MVNHKIIIFAHGRMPRAAAGGHGDRGLLFPRSQDDPQFVPVRVRDAYDIRLAVRADGGPLSCRSVFLQVQELDGADLFVILDLEEGMEQRP